MTWIAAALGGTLGTLARHAVNIAVARSMTPAPYATAIVNILGSAIIGALAGSISSGRLLMPAPLRTFVFVGLLGGFTTFSSFMLDTLSLAEGGSTSARSPTLPVKPFSGSPSHSRRIACSLPEGLRTIG
jgi:CrcB protein